MPHGAFNWTFNDAVRFLKSHGFSLSHVRGSHYYFSGYQNGAPRLVCVQFHGTKALKPRTLNGMIVQSGIPKSEWMSWGG